MNVTRKTDDLFNSIIELIETHLQKKGSCTINFILDKEEKQDLQEYFKIRKVKKGWKFSKKENRKKNILHSIFLSL